MNIDHDLTQTWFSFQFRCAARNVQVDYGDLLGVHYKAPDAGDGVIPYNRSNTEQADRSRIATIQMADELLSIGSVIQPIERSHWRLPALQAEIQPY